MCDCMMLSQTSSLDSSKLLCDRKGEGNEKKSRGKCKHGEWGIDRKRSNKTRVMERKQDNNIRGKKATLYSKLSTMEE